MPLQPVPMGQGAYRRSYAQAPEIRMVNRFFERYPTNAEGAALISRPGSMAFEPGIAATSDFTRFYTEPGVFDGDLFVATEADGIFRLSPGGTLTPIVDSDVIGSNPSFAASVGLYHENLFVASETGLGYYDARSRARAFVKRNYGIAVLLDQTVRVGSVYYKWRGAGTVEAGTPAGTAANPYLLNHDNGSALPGFEDYVALYSLQVAVNASGIPGTDYSSALTTPNPDIRADPISAPLNLSGYLYFTALDEDAGANLLELEGIGTGFQLGTPSTAAAPSPATINFTGGGAHEFTAVTVPDGAAVQKVVALNGYVLVLIDGSQQFYFIRPGEVAVDALDFFSAESLPDKVQDALVIGDLVWFFGARSVEAWFATGSSERPFQRMTGQTFSIGGLRNTPVVVNGKAIFVGSDGCVYLLDGAPRRVSNHGIEEITRSAIQNELDLDAWTFSLDGHYFYILTISGLGTYVFDESTGEWHQWYSTLHNPAWGLNRGAVWGPRVVALNPLGTSTWELNFDSFLDNGAALIPRVVTGFLPHRAIESATNSFLRVYGSIGKPDSGTPDLSLRFSDDNGETWQGPFTVQLSTSETQNVEFRSLGRVGAPGRLFELSDTGGLVRIDGVYAQID